LWVFFIFFGGDGTHLPHPRRSLYTPPVHPLPTPAHPKRRHTTGSRAGRARCKADHATHRHTRPDAGHAAPIYTRYQTGHAGRSGRRRGLDCLLSASGKVYNFGRFILSIFIWIYFAESIDNPYIYGYNIISPDKYGLQPQYTKTGGQKP
jgi:hypothetical protein